MSFEQDRKQKLPFLPFTRKMEQDSTDDQGSGVSAAPNITNTFFQAFNFKARKVALYKNKKSFAQISESLTNQWKERIIVGVQK